MVARPDATRTESKFARLSASECDQILDTFGWHLMRDDEDIGCGANL